MNQKRGWSAVLTVGLVIAMLAILLVAALPARGAQQRERFDWLIAKRVTVLEGGVEVYSDVTLLDDLAVGNAVDVDGALDVAGAVTLQNDLAVDDTFNIDDTGYVLTGTQTLTPTATYYAINSAGTVTITLADGANGDILILVNLSANNATIADSNIRTTTGSALTLGQYDVAILLFTGTEWYQLSAQASNS